MFPKVILPTTFRMGLLLLLLLITAQAVYWTINENGLYPTLADQLASVEGIQENQLQFTTGMVVWLVLMIPFVVVALFLRQFTTLPSLREQLAQVRNPNAVPKQAEPTPQEIRIIGIVLTGLGVFLFFANLMLVAQQETSFVICWATGPILFFMGLYALATGKLPQAKPR